MKKLLQHGSVVIVLLAVLFSTAAYMHRGGPQPTDSVDTLLLLIPDSVDPDSTTVKLWMDAAAEEGLHLEIIRDSTFLDPMFRFRAAGLIVPDQMHRNANDALVGALHDYVHQGGKLMLVYDACTWDLNGTFPRLGSRLSDLTGVSYALYNNFGKNTMAQGEIWGSANTMNALQIPPGKFVPMNSQNRPALWRNVSLSDADSQETSSTRFTLVRYHYGDLEYPSFRTSGTFDGKVLLQSSAGLAAGTRKHGDGEVLFVNLPLGYLESRTDGLLLHSFLHYFAVDMLRLPYLAPVPDGIGGLVLNWHIDAASALKSLALLRKEGIFDQGPFSAHFTAGPDVETFGDKDGLDVDRNPAAQEWIRFFRSKGDEVGSHGGWIHNYFGQNIDDTNQNTFEQYLELNKKTLDRVSGELMTEYSAPLGNHPEWVTDWLEKNGFVGYYFAGDAGMGPTRVYRDKGRNGSSIWAFPILHMGTEASLEEMGFDGIASSTVEQWLVGITDFTVRDHQARLVYSHPLGATQYLAALHSWMHHTKELSDEKLFRWYTMTGLANFLNARKSVEWNLSAEGDGMVMSASHPRSLNHETWIFPQALYGQPQVRSGQAEVRTVDHSWVITALDCKSLKFDMKGPLGPAVPSSQQ